jgi:outer membrane protein TolC
MRNLIMIIICFFGLKAFNQETLTLDAAVARALTANYNVLFLKSDQQVNELNDVAGAAGMLPNISLRISDLYSSNDILQRFANGQEITSPNASGNQLSAAVLADWTVFDGLRMFATRERLHELSLTSALSTKQQMAQTVRDVTAAYSLVQQIQQQLAYLQALIDFNLFRKDISETRWNVGNGAKMDYLQAVIELNNAKTSILQNEAALVAAKNQLIFLMGEKSGYDFTVESPAEVTLGEIEELKSKALQNNYDLQIALKRKQIAALQIKEAKSAMLPTVTLNGAYNFTRSDNSAGFSLFNRTFGPSVGLTVTMPLFAAGDVNRSRKTSELRYTQAEILAQQASADLTAQVESLSARIENLNQVKLISEESLDLSKELLDLSLERFKQGQSSSIEVQQAQVAFDQVNTQYLQANFDLQIALAELKLLAGDIE